MKTMNIGDVHVADTHSHVSQESRRLATGLWYFEPMGHVSTSPCPLHPLVLVYDYPMDPTKLSSLSGKSSYDGSQHVQTKKKIGLVAGSNDFQLRVRESFCSFPYFHLASLCCPFSSMLTLSPGSS
jgi:hypothetical protein